MKTLRHHVNKRHGSLRGESPAPDEDVSEAAAEFVVAFADPTLTFDHLAWVFDPTDLAVV